APGSVAVFAGHTAGPCKPLPGLGSQLDVFEKSPVPVPKSRLGSLSDPPLPRSAAPVVRKFRDTPRGPARDNLSRTQPSALHAVARQPVSRETSLATTPLRVGCM